MAISTLFSGAQLEQIARVMADARTHAQYTGFFQRLGLEAPCLRCRARPASRGRCWHRILKALEASNSNNVGAFIEAVMAPVNFVGATEAYATLRISLNGILTEASATVRMSLNGRLALCSLSDSDRKWVFRGLAVSEAGTLMTTATLPSIYDCRVGDTVQRKRGGPHMTIERLDSGMEGGLYRHLTGMEGDPYRHLGMEGGPYRHLTVERCGGPYRHPTVKNCDSGVHCVWHDGEYTSTWRPCELKRDVFSADHNSALRVPIPWHPLR